MPHAMHEVLFHTPRMVSPHEFVANRIRLAETRPAAALLCVAESVDDVAAFAVKQ